MKLSEDKNRLADTLEAAERAFYGVLTKDYPEVKTGDISFDVAIDLSNAMAKAAVHWLDNNEPVVAVKDTKEVTILCHNIEIEYFRDDLEDEVLDYDIEHIAYCITEDIESGVLHPDRFGAVDEKLNYGSWRINNK